MIVKNFEPRASHDLREAAGQQAEQEMAFYLRRAFKDSPALFVFNNLRFQFGEDVAQIDHLILHKYGVILIESKSVSTKVEVNEHGEWMRWFGGQVQGMPSPILQVQRQGEFFKRYLDAHAEDLLGKIVGLQRRFGGMELDILVAISDSGIIGRPRRGKVPPLEEVCKADQIAGQVRALYERHQKANGLGSLILTKDGGYWWTRDEMQRLQAFLLNRHKPLPGNPFSEPTPQLPPLNRSEEELVVAPRVRAEPLVCAICGTVVSEKVALYCRQHSSRFAGRILCFSHQRSPR